MNKIVSKLLTFSLCGISVATTSCIQEFDPQSSTVTVDQAANAPNSYNNFVNTITDAMSGSFEFGSSYYPWDFGYPSLMLQRDVMGQDIAMYNPNFFKYWYESSVALAPIYMVCQIPWTYYYEYIKNCNTVIQMAGSEPDETKVSGAGIAYAMRAMYYSDLAQMYCQSTYALDKDAETVPIITEETTAEQATNNPRATNSEIWAFILSDLDKAETYLADYKRSSVYTPDVTVVYGLKARAYLVMQDWANAEKYAKLAQQGYTIMTESEYTDWDNGFNTPTGSWMFALKYNESDSNIKLNDGDSSWGSEMCLEVDPVNVGMGYASNYGDPKAIDRHLYETIPATDFRKKCFVDFAIDDMSNSAQQNALLAYTKYPSWIQATADAANASVGGLSLKFRLAQGDAGRANQYVGFSVAVPLMRVEEMYLIEAEAAGMQSEARGQQLLTAFAQKRDPNYTYGQHFENYGSTYASNFQNEVWWQRRVELWGEGFTTFDIKRLQKNVIRSYANTNHPEGDRWNTNGPAAWMTLCIVQSETNYNFACTNNPTPVKPTSDSAEYTW
jgi:hypothetical protein